MNKSKRQIFHQLALLTGMTEIVWQVTSYSKMFGVGSLHLIHGKITILPVARDTGTAAWFVTCDTLPEWKNSGPRSLLWIHGKRESSSHYTSSGTDGFYP